MADDYYVVSTGLTYDTWALALAAAANPDTIYVRADGGPYDELWDFGAGKVITVQGRTSDFSALATGTDRPVVNRSSADRCFLIENGLTGNVIRNVIFQEGASAGAGAFPALIRAGGGCGWVYDSDLWLEDCDVFDCSYTGTGYRVGGAIGFLCATDTYVRTLTMKDCLFERNTLIGNNDPGVGEVSYGGAVAVIGFSSATPPSPVFPAAYDGGRCNVTIERCIFDESEIQEFATANDSLASGGAVAIALCFDLQKLEDTFFINNQITGGNDEVGFGAGLELGISDYTVGVSNVSNLLFVAPDKAATNMGWGAFGVKGNRDVTNPFTVVTDKVTITDNTVNGGCGGGLYFVGSHMTWDFKNGILAWNHAEVAPYGWGQGDDAFINGPVAAVTLNVTNTYIENAPGAQIQVINAGVYNFGAGSIDWSPLQPSCFLGGGPDPYDILPLSIPWGTGAAMGVTHDIIQRSRPYPATGNYDMGAYEGRYIGGGGLSGSIHNARRRKR